MNEQWFPLEMGLSAALGCHMASQSTPSLQLGSPSCNGWYEWIRGKALGGDDWILPALLGGA